MEANFVSPYGQNDQKPEPNSTSTPKVNNVAPKPQYYKEPNNTDFMNNIGASFKYVAIVTGVITVILAFSLSFVDKGYRDEFSFPIFISIICSGAISILFWLGFGKIVSAAEKYLRAK